MSSREHLDMDRVENGVHQRGTPAPSAVPTKIDFQMKRGCFIERGVVIFICIVVAFAIVATGLLAAYFGACSTSTSQDGGESSTPPKSGSETVQKHPYLKLPTSIVPEHYIVELQPFLIPENFTINGKVKIRVLCTEKTSNITLHVKDLDIDKNSLRLTRVDGSEDVPSIQSTAEDSDKQFFILNVNKELQDGVRYEVSMQFGAYLSDNLSGFYRSSYKDKSKKKM